MYFILLFAFIFINFLVEVMGLEMYVDCYRKAEGCVT